MARSDPSPVVRLYLASACQRLPLGRRWEILEGLVAHAEDAADHNLPLMIWYAAEPLAALDAGRAARLAAGAKLPQLLPWMGRRIAAIGSAETIALLVDELGRTKRPAQRLALLFGINEALKGRREVAMPAAWPAVSGALGQDPDPQVRAQATALGVTFGDASALAATRRIVADVRAPRAAARRAGLAAEGPRPGAGASLLSLVADPALRAAALRGLAAYDDPRTPRGHPRRLSGARPGREARRAGRPGRARRLRPGPALGRRGGAGPAGRPLGRPHPPVAQPRRPPRSGSRSAGSGGVVRATPEGPGPAHRLLEGDADGQTGPAARPGVGAAVFARTCQQCHTLFGVGGRVGPELTGSNRADLDYLLANVLDPGALIGKDYLAHVVATADGRVLTGIVTAEDRDALTLVTPNETLVLPKAEIEERRVSDSSMMPDDLWKSLSEHEIRSLVAYLAGGGPPAESTPKKIEPGRK
jgi:putative heme-binding domain-containing protein